MSLSDQTDSSRRAAIITGASGGIGRAVAIELAARGFDLLLTGRNIDRLEATARAARDGGSGNVHCLEADLFETEAPATIVDTAVCRFGGFNLLVCNAGIALSKPLEETTLDEWDRIMAINARAPFMLYKSSLPHLRKSANPMIVSISSIVGRVGYTGQTAYSASKHALEGLTKAFAREVQSEGIRVHLVAPGGVATQMVRSVRPDIDEDELISPGEVGRIVGFLVDSRGNGVIDEISIRRQTATPWQ